MEGNLIGIAKPLEKTVPLYEFSICTLVTKKEEYAEMISSFIDMGFSENRCEYIFADNSHQNQFDAYEAINLFLRQAKGQYVIICHQDILIDKDGIAELRMRLKELDLIDPNWAVCGNAGGVAPNHLVYHISYPDQQNVSKGKFPIKVQSLDENFVLLKNNALLKVSNQLSGFHLYATDLCLQAELNGYSAYAIAFNLTHKSRGNKDKSFAHVQKQLVKQYNSFFRSRWIQTNSTQFYLSGSIFRGVMDNPISLFFARIWNGIKKRLN